MMRNNSHSYKRGVTGFYPSSKSFWSCSRMNCCLQDTQKINLQILYIIQVKISSKIQELQRIHQVHQKL